MEYNQPLVQGRFLKRYKRFFADVEITSENGLATVVAHVPNTGSLKGICTESDRLCRVQRSTNPERKLQWTLEQVKTPTSWVGVNTHNANEIAWEAFTTKALPAWHKYTDGQREVKLNAESRLDMRLTGNGPAHFVEVKNVTMAEGEMAMFPDAVTTRGQKHLIEMMKLISEGATAELLFVVQRTDCARFTPAKAIDPDYARLLSEAAKAGVLINAYGCQLTETKLTLDPLKKIEIVLT